jgi:Enoyl-CoA hydratase/isomerase
MTAVPTATGPVVAAADLPAQLAASGLRLRDDGTPMVGVVIVDLTGPIPDAALAAARRAGSTVIVIGVADDQLSPAATVVARELTGTLVPWGEDRSPAEIGVPDPPATALALAAAIEHCPRAAATLAGVLRVTGQLPVADGLVVESGAYSALLAGGEFRRWLAGRPHRRAQPESGAPVLIARSGAELQIVLNRPERRNAFGRSMRDGLLEAIDVALADRSIDRVVLRGTGPAFCSGGDLDEFGTSTDVSTAHLIRLDRGVAARLDRCHERVVARVHGACIGAGIELASFAGRVVARPDSFFQLPELAMGLLPGAGGTVGITRRIGRWRTAYLALSGVRLDVGTALDWGLIDAVDDD